MIQNNLELCSSYLLPNKPLEPNTKRFIRHRHRKVLIPHKPKFELDKNVQYVRPQFRREYNNSKKLVIKDTGIDLSKRQIITFETIDTKKIMLPKIFNPIIENKRNNYL